MEQFYEVVSASDMGRVASDVLGGLQPAEQATILALLGDLGAGKTTFTQAVAKELGVEEVVTSPTFVIEKIYHLSGQAFARLIHIDCYRLKGASELESLGWQELAQDPANLILVEWPELVGDLIKPAVTIEFAVASETTRKLTIKHG